MIPLEFLIAGAFIIDLLVGDPAWAPHPVRWMGSLAIWIESPFRRMIHPPRLAGILAAITVISASGLCAWAAIRIGAWIHPILGDLAGLLIIYWGLATRDLLDHCRAVFSELIRPDMVAARKKVGMICGRDTDSLDEQEITRATVESASENLVDGVFAPLFFVVLGGPAGLMMYKAVSTLDSTFGYKNARYMEFGWASARLDDIVAYFPARLSGPVIALAAFLAGLDGTGALKIFLRDRLRHPSPNAGHSEAAFAGALNIRLGGPAMYGGELSMKPDIGDPIEPMDPEKITQANRLVLLSSSIFLIMVLVASIALRCAAYTIGPMVVNSLVQ